ncbi:unnamed protein product [Clonostachys byssicola]|uniref:AB hydrolase-1 domain-containing protein n=1 Tax=Clonostachys byssicola TaxID=160290 RepID=A0A9N9XYF5_9HYPO|nr:unnamed protein product [Clonostachys byssicola]
MPPVESSLICIVHGGWHQPLHYRHLIEALTAKGHTVVCPQLATSGYDDAVQKKNYHDDVARVHESLLPYLDQGRKAVVIGHSFGGITATAATSGHTVEERTAKGLLGGISSLIYISAYPDHTKPILSCALADPEKPVIDPVTQIWTHQGAAEILYHDSDPDKLQPALAQLLRLSGKALTCEPICTAPQVKTDKYFLVSKNDRIIPADYQRECAEYAGATITELDCGHSAFLRSTEVERIVDFVGDVLGKAK